MARIPLMAGNWKMNNTISEAVVLSQEISNNWEKGWKECVDIVLCTPFPDLKPVKTVLDYDRTRIYVAAQNVYWQEAGAFTGEVSVRMLAEIGVSFCIVGHSERRSLFGDTNEEVNKKAKALLAGGIAPIICAGESLAIREEGTTDEFVCAQVRAAFAGIAAADARTCVVGYEPVWAIGTGRTATPDQAQAACAAIRAQLTELYGAEVADEVRILYGGSMNEGNVEELVAQPDIDGGLVGGASLKASSFINLVKACVK